MPGKRSCFVDISITIKGVLRLKVERNLPPRSVVYYKASAIRKVNMQSSMMQAIVCVVQEIDLSCAVASSS